MWDYGIIPDMDEGIFPITLSDGLCDLMRLPLSRYRFRIISIGGLKTLDFTNDL